MKITIKDCLDLSAFDGCIVAAGRNNISNRISSVSVLDATDSKTALENNGVNEQLVLTSFYGLDEDIKAQTEIVEGLAKTGVGGIAVFHSNENPLKQYSSIIKKAESLNLPLIIMNPDEGGEYSDAIEQVMDRVLYNENVKNDLVTNSVYHLLNFEKYTNFPAALREAAISNDLQVVLLSKDFNPVLVVETRHKIEISDAVRTLKEDGRDNTKIYSLLNVEDVATYWGTVTIEKERYILMIVDNEDNYLAGEITKLAEIIELAIGMWKYTPERDVKAEFIKALTRGNKSLAYYLKDEMEIDKKNIISVFLGREIDTQAGEDVFADFEKEEGFEVMKIQEGEETAGVIIKTSCNGKEEFDIQKIKASCLGLFDRLKSNSKSVRVFHSTGVDGIEGAADGFKLISETMTFVENVFPYKRVFTKYELVLVSNCINIQVQGGYLKKNYAELLEAFDKEMGANKAKQLLDTLETFVLDAGMNSAKTSEFMGIHTNTVQYRLKRINEVLGAEITGNRIIPGLTIALALKRLERAGN